jgi:DNA polymerase I-like protein with 3'-5' exonuclease and polymerase domains
LEALPYPEAKKLAEFFIVNKRLGQLAEGKQAWTKKCKSGKIHGRVDTLGAITNRMTHMDPNLAQVPANHAPYGEQCRALFGPREGWKQVGCDADGLEGRCLGHYLYPYDGGAFNATILEGDKDAGTDLHSKNRDNVGIRTRDGAKTIFYGWMYGAGDHKLGSIYVEDMDDEQKAKFYAAFPAGKKRDAATARLGKRSRDRLVAGIHGMDQLLSGVKAKAKCGWLKAIDGRRLRVRSEHAALNTLLQGAGAIIMKQALVLADEQLRSRFTLDEDFHYLLNVHDEMQLECRPEIADEVGQILQQSIADAGDALNFRCPLEGSYDIGNNWAETH